MSLGDESFDVWGPRPAAWLAFAIAVLAIPISALVIQSHQPVGAILPTVNATLNGISALLLFGAWRAIRARWVGLHWRLMVAALVTSGLFLVSYLARVALTGTHRYPGHGWKKTVYLVVLASHTMLAAFVPVLALLSLRLALKKRFSAHRRLARIALPIWFYVSVTGVVVYLMLYRLA